MEKAKATGINAERCQSGYVSLICHSIYLFNAIHDATRAQDDANPIHTLGDMPR